MYPGRIRYYRPSTLQECWDLMRLLGESSKVLSGGQTLIPMLKMRVDEPSALIDISRLEGLGTIDVADGGVSIGALATHARIVDSSLAGQVPIIRDCAEGIADAQVRNLGTIGGSLSVADPSGDWPVVLHVLDAKVECQSQSGARTIAVEEFVVGAYTTALIRGEIVTRVRFRLPAEGSGGAYVGYKKAAPAYPTAAAGAQLTLARDGSCGHARLVLGSAGPKAVVCTQANDVLRNQKLTRQTIERAADMILEKAAPVADSRGSVKFKKTLLKLLVVEAVERAEKRANGESVAGGHKYV